MKSTKTPGRKAGWIGAPAARPAARSEDTPPASEHAASSGGYHHGNLRAALIEAGLQALEADDRDDLSLRELARRVGVSANAAYRHFANKDALLAALAAEGFRRLDQAEAAAAAEVEDAHAGFKAAGRAYVQFAVAHPALFRLMFGRFTCTRRDPELVEASMTGFQSLLGSVAALGGLQPHDPQALLRALLAWSVVHGLSHLALGGQLDRFSSGGGDDVRRLADAVLSLVDLPSDAGSA